MLICLFFWYSGLTLCQSIRRDPYRARYQRFKSWLGIYLLSMFPIYEGAKGRTDLLDHLRTSQPPNLLQKPQQPPKITSPSIANIGPDSCENNKGHSMLICWPFLLSVIESWLMIVKAHPARGTSGLMVFLQSLCFVHHIAY